MFGRSRKSPAARAELRCSFCNKGERDVRKLIAGPVVFICDECVDVCVSILAHDRRASGEAGSKSTGSTAGAARWPSSDAWCAFCGNVADLENALLIENRTLLCEPCVQAIAAAASQRQKAN